MHKQSFTVCIKLKMIISSPRFTRNVNKVRKRRISMAKRDRFLSSADTRVFFSALIPFEGILEWRGQRTNRLFRMLKVVRVTLLL